MVEEEKQDQLEKDFRVLETNLTQRIKSFYEKAMTLTPAGVSVEIASDFDRTFRLYLNSNGEWAMRYQMAGHPIGVKPDFSRILEDYMFVTEPTFREMEPEMQSVRIQENREEIAKRLSDRMRGVMEELQETALDASFK
jgi:hypothetical protein